MLFPLPFLLRLVCIRDHLNISDVYLKKSERKQESETILFSPFLPTSELVVLPALQFSLKHVSSKSSAAIALHFLLLRAHNFSSTFALQKANDLDKA